LDGSRCKDCEANKIELCRERAENRDGFGLVHLLRDFDQKEHRRNEATDGEVNIEASY